MLGSHRVLHELGRHSSQRVGWAAAPARKGTHIQSVKSKTTLTGSPVRTEVVDRVSPAALIETKRQQLSQIGPGGWKERVMYPMVSLPVWAASAVQLLAKYAMRPDALMNAPDPTSFPLTPPFPIHEEYITVNGIKLHAVSPGRQPDKPLLLMLHGFPECWYSWRHQMAALADDWDVVALDMRGYNTSDKPQGVDNYKLQQLASDVKEAVAALGHKQCTLVAHDWGGVVAWVVAGLYGQELVQQLIVMGLPHLGIGMTNGSMQQKKKQLYILLFQARGLSEKVITADNAAAMERMFRTAPVGVRNPEALDDADMAWFRAAACQPGAATGMLSYYRALLRFTTTSEPNDPVWGALKRQLDMPTLVLHGDSDVALGTELLDGIEAAVPQVTVKLLLNCSHWVQQDYPQQVTEIMLDWLQQQQQQQQEV